LTTDEVEAFTRGRAEIADKEVDAAAKPADVGVELKKAVPPGVKKRLCSLQGQQSGRGNAEQSS